jgi:hypothetical protein
LINVVDLMESRRGSGRFFRAQENGGVKTRASRRSPRSSFYGRMMRWVPVLRKPPIDSLQRLLAS